MEKIQPSNSRRQGQNERGGWPLTRVIAALVLIPSIPMLLGSIAALALFYMAPTRFGNVIARLPGESLIRSMLVFAPATLLAVVVLAVLYAVDQTGSAELSATGPARLAQERVVEAGRYSPAAVRQTALGLALFPIGAAFLVSLAVWSLSFVSPGRFERLLEPLPGERYLRALVPLAPWILFALVLVLGAALAVQSERKRSTHRGSWAQDMLGGVERWARWAVTGMLFFALPALGISLMGLAAMRLRPERVAVWFERLSFDTLVRFGLLFTPPVLFAVVMLGLVFLAQWKPGVRAENSGSEEASEARGRSSLRSVLATGVMVVGFSFSAAFGLGLLAAVAYLLIR